MPERQTKAKQGRHERMLLELLKMPGNDQCADCNSKHPRWASYSLGVFLCIRCAALHRKMGTHISRVKSVTMDEWTQEQIDMIRKGGGNQQVNSIVNPHPERHPLPLAEEDERAMEKYIRNKWEKRLFMDTPEKLTKQVTPKPVFRSQTVVPPTSAAHAQIPPKRSMSVPVVVNDREQYGPLLAKLYEMGFRDEQQNRQILRQTQGDMPAAVEILSRIPGAQKVVFPKPNLTDEQKMAILNARGFTNIVANQDALRRSAGNVEVAIEILQSAQKAAVAEVTPDKLATPSAFSSSPSPQELAGRAQNATERQAYKLAGAQTDILVDVDDRQPNPTTSNNTGNPFHTLFQQPQQSFFPTNANPFGPSSPALTNLSNTTSGASVQPQLTGFVPSNPMAPASFQGDLQAQMTGLQQPSLGHNFGLNPGHNVNQGPLTPALTGVSNPFSQMTTGQSLSLPNTPSNMVQDRFGYFPNPQQQQQQQQPFSSSALLSSPSIQTQQLGMMTPANSMQPNFTAAVSNQQTGFQPGSNIFSTTQTFPNSTPAASNPMMVNNNNNPWATSGSSFF